VLYDMIAHICPALFTMFMCNKLDFGRHSRARVAAGKAPVFGLLKRQSKVYVANIANADSQTHISIIREKIGPDSVVFSDACRSYDVLDVSKFRHMRVGELIRERT
jgi:transposase-like protein